MRCRCNNLLIGLQEVGLYEMLEVLEIADLTGDLETFTICCSALIEALHSLVGVRDSIVKE